MVGCGGGEKREYSAVLGGGLWPGIGRCATRTFLRREESWPLENCAEALGRHCSVRPDGRGGDREQSSAVLTALFCREQILCVEEDEYSLL